MLLAARLPSYADNADAVSWLIEHHPDLAVRDRAVRLIYRQALLSDEGKLRGEQSRWRVSTLQCKNAVCLQGAFDERIGQLVHRLSSNRQAVSYLSARPRSEGKLEIFRGSNWICFNVMMTAYNANASGRTALASGVAINKGAAFYYSGLAGCEIRLFPSRGAWQVDSSKCGFDDGASVTGSYHGEAGGR